MTRVQEEGMRQARVWADSLPIMISPVPQGAQSARQTLLSLPRLVEDWGGVQLLAA